MGRLLHELRLVVPWLAILPALAAVAPRLGATVFRAVAGRIARFARNRVRAVVACGMLTFLAAVSATLLLGIPAPGVEDEFSYLLAADTFAHGRLTNAPHPLWPFFESIHILVQPTYMSKYPAGQGLLLALGQVLAGSPIVGIWIGAGLGGATLCWMLHAWLPRRYAVLGGLLAAVHPLFLTWSHDYWGGWLALTGGALATGGFRRIVDHGRPRDAALMGLGVTVMGLTRPYEGLVLTTLLLAALPWLTRQEPVAVPIKALALRCGLPFAVPIMLFAIGTGIYNRAVTGSALRLPYTVYEQQYDPAPLFVWQQMRPIPPYRHAEIRDFFLKVELQPYIAQRTPRGFIAARMDKLSNVVVQYLRPLTLLLPLTTLPWAARRDRWTRFALVVSFLFILLLLPDIYVSPHYIAVYFPVSYVLLLMAIRQLRSWTWRGRRIGRALVRLVAVSYLWSAIGAFAGQVRQHHVFGDKGWSAARAHILSRLRDRAGDHLVVVRYSPSHNLHAEWVYNEADIDHSRVVWAHEMEGKSNNELFHYFRGRFLWLLFADASPARLVPYPVNRPNQDK